MVRHVTDAEWSAIFDKRGKVIPSPEAKTKIAASHPANTDGERWRLAQAQTVIDLLSEPAGDPAVAALEGR